MDSYEACIHEMSELIDLPLQIGPRGQFVLAVDGMVEIHIEHIAAREHIRFAALLWPLPPDAVRERVLESALKANSTPYAHAGVLAFSKKRSSLVIYKHIPLEKMTADLLCDYLEQFILSSKAWIEALQSGRTEPDGIITSGGDGGLFGLR